MKSDSGDIPYAEISGNTMNVTITYTTPVYDPLTVQMWNQTFIDAANRTGGIPQTYYQTGNTTDSAFITIYGPNDPIVSGTGNKPDLSLKVKAVNLTASILNLGGT